jgi:hypothetical protein
VPDGIRMMDVASLSRALDELRRLGPEQRVLARRAASAAAAKEIAELHQEVEELARTTAARAESARDEERNRKGRDRRPEPANAARAEPPPELDQGRLIDLKI